jgi:hypothetical protein
MSSAHQRRRETEAHRAQPMRRVRMREHNVGQRSAQVGKRGVAQHGRALQERKRGYLRENPVRQFQEQQLETFNFARTRVQEVAVLRGSFSSYVK